VKYKGDSGDFEVFEDRLIIHRSGVQGRLQFGKDEPPRVIPFGAIREVLFQAPKGFSTGWLRLVLGDDEVGTDYQAKPDDPDAMGFLSRGTQQWQELFARLQQVVETSRTNGVEPSSVPYPRGSNRAEQSSQSMAVLRSEQEQNLQQGRQKQQAREEQLAQQARQKQQVREEQLAQQARQKQQAREEQMAQQARQKQQARPKKRPTTPEPATKEHPILGLAMAVGLLVLLVAGGFALFGHGGGNGKSTNVAASAGTPTSHPAVKKTPPPVPAPPPVDPDVAEARSWTAKYAKDANAVRVSVQSTQLGVGLLQQQKEPVSASDLAALSSLVKQSQDTLDGVAMDTVNDLGGRMSAAKEQAWQGVYELKDSMGKLRDYLDDQKPSTLSDFNDKYQSGTQDWNDGVTALWTKAGKKPPTV